MTLKARTVDGTRTYTRDNIVQVILGVQFRLPATVGIAYAFYTGKSSGK